jgi:hypothetical protein
MARSQVAPSRRKRLDEQIASLDKHFDNRIDKCVKPPTLVQLSSFVEPVTRTTPR